ncbi:HAAS signaling domain-containing protein [Bacillus sp. JJ1562]|uniref:HAAS signaling domain-containing protein n=1 Tax=Bacillus sp. JJ1562 TaxID=3122960 RepID=UPI0030033469
MNLIDIYIQEVTRRLPEKMRDDIALELRSTIEDMLPDDYNEADVKTALEKLGSPVKLANNYRDRPMYLIGPRYFDVYVSLLKMILPIAAVVALISTFAEYFIGYQGEEAIINVVLDLIGFGIWKIIEVSIQTFFWFTLVFAMIERIDKGKDNQPLTTSLQKWTPDDLKYIAYIPKKKKISKCEVFGALLWTAIWATLYFYANQLLGIYEGGNDGLEFVTPALNQEVLLSFWPIVLVVIGLEVALALYKLIIGQWTKRMVIYNTTIQVFSTILFIVIFINPNILNQDFTSYMTDLFGITDNQFTIWLIATVLISIIVSAAITIFDGIRKANIR